MKVLNNGFIELIDVMGNDMSIINAARKSFSAKKHEDDIEMLPKDLYLLQYLWENQHTSPFEMVEFKFAVKAPLFVIRQWQRHRTWSYNEVSRRYTSEDLDFYVPEEWRLQSEDNKQASEGAIKDPMLTTILRSVIIRCNIEYEKLLKSGVCREQARMVLPQNMMVEMIAKVDLSNLIKFLKLRNHPHAQWEIQEYAKAIEILIEKFVPETMKLYRKDRWEMLKKERGKNAN